MKTSIKHIHNPHHTWINVLGWVGVVFVLGAFLMINLRLVDAHDRAYQVVNILGAIFLITEAAHKKDYQPVVLNIIWILIALLGVVDSVYFS